MEKAKEIYLAPDVEVVEVQIEKGYAASGMTQYQGQTESLSLQNGEWE